ncbi:MAG: FG-GAP-like repeat-containing protein [Candidatus Poseidoniales archaeon]
MTQHKLNTNKLGHQGAKAKTLAQGMVLLMLFSSLANLGIALVDYDESPSVITSDDLQQDTLEGYATSAGSATPSPISVNDYTEGGRHLVTDSWWQPQGKYIPSSYDHDGDGIINTIDLAPFDRNSGARSACSTNCIPALAPLLEEPFTPAWIEDAASPLDAITALELADMDNDGDLDLILGDSSYLYISWNDKGTFLDPKDSSHGMGTNFGHMGGTIYTIKAVDLDLDDDLDIVIGMSNNVKAIEMENSASVQTVTLALSSGGSTNWMDISIGDVDGDGYPDILAGAYYGSGSSKDAAVLMENGGGFKQSFTKVWSFSVYDGVRSSILTDWDADGYLDILIGSGKAEDDSVSSYSTTWIYGFKSNAGTISSTRTFNSSGGTSAVMGLAAADLNGDAYPELIVSSFNQKTYVLRNSLNASEPFSDDFTISDSTVGIICSTKCISSNPRIVDINNDGLSDLLLGTSDKNTQTESHIYLHNGFPYTGVVPTFSYYKTYDYDGYDDFAVGDITGNGLPDIIYQSDVSPFEIYRAGGGTMSESVSGNLSFLNASTYNGVGSGLVGDYDSDGDDDVIALDQGGVYVFEQTGAGITTASDPLIDLSGTSARNVQMIDIDKDGNNDILVGTTTNVKAYFRQNDGSYSTGTTAVTTVSGTTYTNIELAGGFGFFGIYNGIAIEEYSYSTYTAATVQIYYSSTFYEMWTSPSSTSTTGKALDLQMADMNGDGRKDLVRCLANQIQIYNSTITGSGWTTSYNFSTTPWVISVGTSGFCSISDVDGDGTLDILTKYGYNGRVIKGPSYSSSNGLGYSNYLNHIQAYDIDRDGELEFIIQRGTGGKGSIVEIDNSGSTASIGEESWTGGGRRNTYATGFGDINGDGLLDLVQFNYFNHPEYILGLSDIDNDAVPDSDDDFPYDPTQKDDSDSDGYGNSNTGLLGDDCPYYWGDSTEDRRGCPDQDGDGWSDLNDAFWRDTTQWTDVDGDGLGDNATGNTPDQYIYDFDNDGYNDSALSTIGATAPFDDCEYTVGTSTNDRYGCLDSDTDGWSNIIDVFPADSTQYADSDSDGYGDSNRGNLPDACPNTSGTSHVDVFGCTDTDGDGTSFHNDFDDNNSNEVKDSDNDSMGDNGDNCPYEWSNLTTTSDRGCRDLDGDRVADRTDDFQSDSTQWRDSDGDGRGDRQNGNNPDAFPADPTQTDDTDGDGHGDSATGNSGDLFPTDETQWQDYDGDGRGDNQSGNNSDDFPTQASQTDDTDGDGYGDNPTGWQADAFPLDETQWQDYDGDGRGDNQSGNNSDDFPTQASQTDDTDGDGYGDNPTGWQADAFPLDETQYLDSDGDGYGNNASGNNSDEFPGESTQHSDADGDGYGDNPIGVNADAFPTDSDQHTDTDGDGYGDAQGFNSSDAFINDEDQWADADNDGYGDNPYGVGYDAFPNDNTQYLDSDLDGWGNNPSGADPDQCPMTEGYSKYRIENDGSTTEYFGCEDDDSDNVPNSFDDCQTSAGASWIDRKACTDSDGDGVSDQYDPYPYNASANATNGDWDGDGVMDYRPGHLLNGLDVFPNDITQTSDNDGDGYGDNRSGNNADQCLTTPLKEKIDVDERGCAPDEVDDDNDGISNLHDDCPDSDIDEKVAIDGCLDSDEDGLSNDYDAFPDDANESLDTDDDGIGNEADDCAGTAGNSWRDKTGCEDSDGDGYSNQADLCPNLWGLANAPHVGCPDRDEDGVADQVDAFPDDRNETTDRDKDGLGDESDQYPDDHDNDGVPTNEDWDDFDSTESMDSDDDSVGDNADVWPDDPDVWSDGDGDGYSDQLGHRLSDDCPSIPGNSTKFQDGCSDLDGDGMPDVLDPDIDGDGITNDNEMDASSGDVEYDPFDAKSRPDDLDGDNTPDILDSDIDGDGFPNEFENERGSSSEDQNSTPFNIYSDSASGVYYVPGEGFKDNYDPDGYELSISLLINMITSEFLIPLLILPLSMFGMLRKGRRYKKVNKQIRNCKGLDNLNKFEPMIDSMIIGKKVKVEHGILLRNLFERLRSQMEDAPQMPIGVGTSRIGGGGGRRGSPPQSRPGTRPGGQAQTRGGPRRPGM